jgi:hypothetical protein
MARSPSIFNRDNRPKSSSPQIRDMIAKRPEERFWGLAPHIFPTQTSRIASRAVSGPGTAGF